MSIFSSQVVDWWLRKVYKFSVIKCLYSATGWWTGGLVDRWLRRFISSLLLNVYIQQPGWGLVVKEGL
jgi:hypothetical protein